MIPVPPPAIAAARRLFSRLEAANHHDDILRRAKRTFTTLTYPDVLARAVLVNQLYGTNVIAINRMAQRIVSLDDLHSRDDLVETIAALPDPDGIVRRQFKSFASKFAHFFVDGERHPIFDDAALRVLARHTQVSPSAARKWAYEEFSRHFGALKEASRIKNGRDLDHYLWISGMKLRAERASTEHLVNSDLMGLFQAGDAVADLAIVMDAVPDAIRRSS